MKFAHLADCHVGGWRDPLLTELSIEAFEKAIDIILKEQVDFVLIAGDLFNTSLPGIDKIKRVAARFRQLKEASIPLYFIAGSHDYSPSGKTMLDVLEEAGLGVNVARMKDEGEKLRLSFTKDPGTGVKITGILGRMGGLDKDYYRMLDHASLENEPGKKIFLFHALLSELKPKGLEKVDSHPLSLLPKGFDYYAGGHPHFVHCDVLEGHGLVAYTGPLFPNSFSELEELRHGGFFIVEDWKPRRVDVKLKEVESVHIRADKKGVERVQEELDSFAEKADAKDRIILIRLSGTLSAGKPSDLDFRKVSFALKEKGAFCVLRNTAALSSEEFSEAKLDVSKVKDVEGALIREHVKELPGKDAAVLAKTLLELLDTQKQEGERVVDFETRLKEQADKLLG